MRVHWLHGGQPHQLGFWCLTHASCVFALPHQEDAYAAYQAYMREANSVVPPPPPTQEQQQREAPVAMVAPYDPWKLSQPLYRGAGLADLTGAAEGAARAQAAAQSMEYRLQLEAQIAERAAQREAERRRRLEEEVREEAQIKAYVSRQAAPAVGAQPQVKEQPPQPRRPHVSDLSTQTPRTGGRARVPGATSAVEQTQGGDAAAAKRAAATLLAADLQAQIAARAAAKRAEEERTRREDEAEEARVRRDAMRAARAAGDAFYGEGHNMMFINAEEDSTMIAANRDLVGVRPPPWADAPTTMRPPVVMDPPRTSTHAPPPPQAAPSASVRSSVTREEVERLRAALAARDAALEAAIVAAAVAEQRAAAARAGVQAPSAASDPSLLRAYAAAAFGGGAGGSAPPHMLPYGGGLPAAPGYGYPPWGFYPGLPPVPMFMPQPGGGMGPVAPAPPGGEPERSISPDGFHSSRAVRGAGWPAASARAPNAVLDLSGASGSVDLAASLMSDSMFVYPSFVARPPPARASTPHAASSTSTHTAFGSPADMAPAAAVGSEQQPQPPSVPPLSPVPVPDSSPLPARVSSASEDVDAALDRTVDAVEWSAAAGGARSLESSMRRLDAVPPQPVFDASRPRTAGAGSDVRASSSVPSPRRPTTAGAALRSRDDIHDM